MDPDDSDYQSSASSNDGTSVSSQQTGGASGSEFNYGEGSDRSVILGEDAEYGHQVDDAYAGSQSPLKRSAEYELALRPFKRQRNQMNVDYLDLLNREIDDAAHRVCLEDDTALPASQLGLTRWSPPEKKQFFEALSRLGKHDLPGIAARIGTKSPVEVKHYLRVLHEAVVLRRSQHSRSFLEPAEYPAAVELTPQCCHAQEVAADAVSVRQESSENRREQGKWQKYWDVTPEIAAELEKTKPQDDNGVQLAFAKLFHVSKWLQLSDRAFMNSSIPGSNWRYIDEKQPSIWATALDDFHSLALSITRRLVQTTLFISMARIKAKSEWAPSTRKIVRKRDVEAAVASLGLTHNARDFWATSARRLRLDVYEKPPTRHEADEDPMTYEQVEAALRGEQRPRSPSADSEAERLKLEPQPQPPSEDEPGDDSGDDWDNPGSLQGEEARAVNREANEVLWYSAVGIRDLQNTRRALTLRIETERRQERQADAADAYASHAAETQMWELLQQAPPREMPRMQDPARMGAAAMMQRSNQDVETLYPMNRMWADNLEYHAEWETLQRPMEMAGRDNEEG